MLPSIDSLRCFQAAARLLNFRAAARSVALTPAALGQRIQKLEEQLGVVRALLTGEHVREETAHYSVDATLGPYLGGRRPPPIVVGGEGKPDAIHCAVDPWR